MRVVSDRCPFLGARPRGGAGTVLRLPVAHREGRFVVRDAEALERLRAGGQIALVYAAAGGGPAPPGYPENPNGSVEAIAGITNPAGNVLGLMPHPERHVRALHDPQWTRRAGAEGIPEPEEIHGDGFPFFERGVRHAREAGW
jgi:phosphoribosylformylglycinamidine synthase